MRILLQVSTNCFALKTCNESLCNPLMDSLVVNDTNKQVQGIGRGTGEASPHAIGNLTFLEPEPEIWVLLPQK